MARQVLLFFTFGLIIMQVHSFFLTELFENLYDDYYEDDDEADKIQTLAKKVAALEALFDINSANNEPATVDNLLRSVENMKLRLLMKFFGNRGMVGGAAQPAPAPFGGAASPAPAPAGGTAPAPAPAGGVAPVPAPVGGVAPVPAPVGGVAPALAIPAVGGMDMP